MSRPAYSSSGVTRKPLTALMAKNKTRPVTKHQPITRKDANGLIDKLRHPPKSKPFRGQPSQRHRPAKRCPNSACRTRRTRHAPKRAYRIVNTHLVEEQDREHHNTPAVPPITRRRRHAKPRRRAQVMATSQPTRRLNSSKRPAF